MVKNRIIWADSLKGILMLLVILGHSIQVTMGDACETCHIWNLIYSFHMPVFMAVSGWLMYKQTIGWGGQKLIGRRAQQLLIPYLIWSLIVFIKNGVYSIDSFINIFERPDKYYWFLWILFWINVLYHLTYFVASKFDIKSDYILIGLCVILAGIMILFNPRVFGIQLLAYFFLSFTFGYYIHKSKCLQTDNKIILFVLFLIWVVLGWYWSMHELPSWMPIIPHVPTAVLQYSYREITAAIAIYVILNGAQYCLNGSNYLNQWMSKFGEVSLGLYVIHLFYLSYIVDALLSMLPMCSTIGIIVLTCIISFIISYITIVLLLKNKYMSRFLLGKL